MRPISTSFFLVLNLSIPGARCCESTGAKRKSGVPRNWRDEKLQHPTNIWNNLSQSMAIQHQTLQQGLCHRMCHQYCRLAVIANSLDVNMLKINWTESGKNWRCNGWHAESKATNIARHRQTLRLWFSSLDFFVRHLAPLCCKVDFHMYQCFSILKLIWKWSCVFLGIDLSHPNLTKT